MLRRRLLIAAISASVFFIDVDINFRHEPMIIHRYDDFLIDLEPLINSDEPPKPISQVAHSLPNKDANTTRIEEYG